MRFDIENQLCREQAFTGAATVSAYAYKKSSAEQDIAIGRRMAIMIMPTVAAGAGSTHVFDAIQADDKDLTTNKEVLSSISVLAADLTVGSVHELPIPPNVMDRLYLGLQNTATGGTTTVTVDAYLVPQDEIAQYKDFPKVIDALV